MDITLRPGAVAAETEYGTALLDQSSGEYYTLNPTAALIMRTLLDGTLREQAVEQFAVTYGISAREAEIEAEGVLVGENAPADYFRRFFTVT